MELRATWRRATRWIGGATDRRAAREVADAAERVVGRAAAQARLAAVEAEIVALMADDRVPARGRRLRALEQARDDLRAELEEDGAAAPGEPVAVST
ncbi:hypothetical protein [Actinomycetospora sp. NBC_00405]|uniref:hypothetical protein n=1 Tax=Actinomycetospora sp. NBC_00405 TaxID=2975952 RepID=UPI002E21B9AF